MKKIKYIFLIIFLMFCLYIVLFMKGAYETNLIKTILPQNIDNYEDTINVADKSSSIIKIVFEGGDEQKEKLLTKINFDFFEIKRIDISQFFDIYKNNSADFLSENDRTLLKEKKYNEIYNNAIEQLYNPLGISIIPFDKDPYSLLTNFLVSNNNINQPDEKLSVLELRIKNELGLSPDKINKEIENLIKLCVSNENSGKIYLAGTPIHSYYTSKNAIITINIVTILSLFLVLTFSFLFFKTSKVLFPIILSILIGILTGYCAVKLCFKNFQIITMVFSTSVIGLGIDYSLHYFFTKDRDITFIKNLTFSMLTTIIPFIIFYITGIELLKQIAVFSIFGLFAIYCFVLIFYKDFNIVSSGTHIKTNYKICKYLFCIISIMAFCGIMRINFNDSLTAFYKPTKELSKAEKIYEYATGKSGLIQIIAIKGINTEERLKEEEEITQKLYSENVEYISLSKFFPSKSKQEENIKLVKNLYDNNLNNFSNFLDFKQINELKTQKFHTISPPEVEEFLSDKNTSLMYIFSDKEINLKGENAKIVNFKSDIEKYLKEYRHKLLNLFPTMFFCVILLVCILFGLRKGIKIILPSTIGIFGSVGLASLIGGELNLFSLISLFLVLGFTIDYAIFKSEYTQNSEDAVFVSAMTTAFSFLLLSFTSFKLISSIALVLTLGIIISYLCCCLMFRRDKHNAVVSSEREISRE